LKITQASLANPTAVTVGILLVLLFGFLSLNRLPIQLTPDVEQPQIVVNTSWRSSAPEEIESEILEPQEDVLKSLQGVDSMEATASQGRASIVLRYKSGTNLNRALLDLMNALNQVPFYPPDANEPILSIGGNSEFDAVAWFGLHKLPGNEAPIESYQDYVEEVIQSRLERVPGVSQTNAFGGLPNQVRVTFDPYKAAALELDLIDVAGIVGGNVDSSGGFKDLGRRKYTLRFEGQYDIKSLEEMVLEWRDNAPIMLKDVANVEVKLADPTGALTLDGVPAIAINAQAETGVNVMDVDAGLKAVVKELNEGPLARAGLEIIQLYDQTVYIKDSIHLVRNNLLLGFMLAIAVLWWFLRKFKATLAVALSIPISLIVTFIAMDSLGRSLNIISMAGLAFAVGMVLDAAIVVLENIVRMRERGDNPHSAAYSGTNQVWGALLASTTTTVAIFLPIVFLDDVAGQLFTDLAIAISVAVVSSLLVAVSVIPTASTKLLQTITQVDPYEPMWERITDRIMLLTNTTAKRLVWVVGLLSLAVTITHLLFPKTDYLPRGNENQFGAFLLPPPGLSVDAGRQEMMDVINERAQPYRDGEKQPQIKHDWLGIFGNFGFMGGRATDPDEIESLLGVLNREILAGFPDTIAFAQQSQIFQGLGGGRRIDIDIQSNDQDQLLIAARAAYSAVMQSLPGAQVQPVPGLTLSEPELLFVPEEWKIAESGWTRQQLSQISRAMGTGLYVGDYFDGQQRLDIFLRVEEWRTPEELAALPIYTPDGGQQALSSLGSVIRTAGPSQIRRVDRKRTITMQITPPNDISLEEAITALKKQVDTVISSKLGDDAIITYRGSAEALTEALTNMGQSFLLALIILYLLMSALFRSFKDSLLVILTIPLATVGGILSLRITDWITGFQPLDLLTMIGFVILLGLVVNNAILLVYQTRVAERDGLSRIEAVEQAIRMRLRPILMSTLTSLFGMLPLLLIPGAGAELYRGIAAVIVGGMSISTVFTLIFLPSLLQLMHRKAELGFETTKPVIL